MPDAPALLILSSDLMSAVRIADTSAALGYSARTVEQAAELEGARADIVVVDIANAPVDAGEAVARLREANPAARFIAVYRHTEPEQARAARAAGCDLVLNRAQFFTDIGAALARVQAGAAPA